MEYLIYDMIDMHNDTVDTFLDFSETIVNEYHPSDDVETPINKAFGEVMAKFAEKGIYLCCEANELEENSNYYTDEFFRVISKYNVE